MKKIFLFVLLLSGCGGLMKDCQDEYQAQEQARKAEKAAKLTGPCRDERLFGFDDVCPRPDQKMEVIPRHASLGTDGYIICRCIR